ncbi:MAG: hypothetical protein ACRDE2_09220, partial [Chitinophagaceae bacterium]
QLPAAMKQFDYDTIGDVIIHLRYTARDGGQALHDAAAQNLQTAIDSMLVSQKDNGLMRIFSARNEFPTEWYAFLNPASASDDQVLSLNLSPDRFPFFAASGNMAIKSVELVADNSNNPALTAVNNMAVISPASTSITKSLQQAGYGNFPTASYGFSNQKTGTWQVMNSHTNNSPLTGDLIKDLVLIVHYSV